MPMWSFFIEFETEFCELLLLAGVLKEELVKDDDGVKELKSEWSEETSLMVLLPGLIEPKAFDSAKRFSKLMIRFLSCAISFSLASLSNFSLCSSSSSPVAFNLSFCASFSAFAKSSCNLSLSFDALSRFSWIFVWSPSFSFCNAEIMLRSSAVVDSASEADDVNSTTIDLDLVSSFSSRLILANLASSTLSRSARDFFNLLNSSSL
mmetsp:Transcript_9503/g.17878  ORF Transcript_9503/g.17878 Transcript_9503/m.17878 type:complete len:207 (+) Transcript_9503:365-985(+)